MRSETMPAIVQIDAKELAKLFVEVKETIATNIVSNTVLAKTNSFGIVDLWNLRRNSKSAASMRSNRNF